MWKGSSNIRALLTALALVLVAQVAHADSNSGVMHGCVKRTGVLRLADICQANERPVEWNKQGPEGPTGTATTALAPGTLTGVHRVGGQIPKPEAGNYVAKCPAGEGIVSGSALYTPGIDLPFVELAVEIAPVEPNLGNSMAILFSDFEVPDGTTMIEWTLVCAVVV